MGKSTEEIKKMAKKETAKAPISPIWLGMRHAPPPPFSSLVPCHLPIPPCGSTKANRTLSQASSPSWSSAG